MNKKKLTKINFLFYFILYNLYKIILKNKYEYLCVKVKIKFKIKKFESVCIS